MSTLHASLHVFTFKAGVLARVAHDLRLSLRVFDLTLQGGELNARFDLRSLCVDGVATQIAQQRRVDAAGISEADKRKIERVIAQEILKTDLQPMAAYRGRVRALADNGYAVDGELELRKTVRVLPLQVEHGHDALIARASFAPSSFGIAPYKALAGAIRLADRVEITLTVSLEGRDPRSLLAAVEPWHVTSTEVERP